MGRALLQRVCKASATVFTVALVLLALGSAVGRWQVLPVNAAGAHAEVGRGSLAFVEPVPTVSLREGDTIFFTTSERKGSFHRVTTVVDSWNRRVELDGARGESEVVQLPANAWRVSRAVPYLGFPFALLAGPVQAVLLVLNGVLLVAFGESRRRPTPPPDATEQGSSGRRQARTPASVAAAACIATMLPAAMSGLALLS
jgi:hypothetical protein